LVQAVSEGERRQREGMRKGEDGRMVERRRKSYMCNVALL
jgi:hypothetical protein